MPDMKVSVGLRWKSCGDVALMLIGGQIVGYNRADKIETFVVVGVSRGFVTHQVHLVKFYNRDD